MKMTAIELTDKELRLAKANVAYALENCPVEGGMMTEDNQFSTKNDFGALRQKLKTFTAAATQSR
jgi:rRNA maturation protein Nop10